MLKTPDGIFFIKFNRNFLNVSWPLRIIIVIKGKLRSILREGCKSAYSIYVGVREISRETKGELDSSSFDSFQRTQGCLCAVGPGCKSVSENWPKVGYVKL